MSDQIPTEKSAKTSRDSVRDQGEQLSLEIGEMPASTQDSQGGERKHTPISTLTKRNWSPFHSPPPPTWLEWFGAQLAFWVLLAIVILVGVFVAIWRGTLPSMNDIATATPNKSPAELAEAYTRIRDSHNKWVTEFFQSVVVSTLVPIFTLLAGYAFGTKNSDRNNNHEDN